MPSGDVDHVPKLPCCGLQLPRVRAVVVSRLARTLVLKGVLELVSINLGLEILQASRFLIRTPAEIELIGYWS